MTKRNEESVFDRVGKIVRKMPDVTEGTLHGAPSWKFGGKILCCPALHKSAEPDSLMVRVGFEERDRLLVEQPDACYVTGHYQQHPVILVRLAKMDAKSLQTMLKKAWLFVSEGGKK